MTPELTKSQYALDQLDGLTQTLEKEKVQLTPEVEEYVRNHVRAVQDKLQTGQDVRESDLEFIPKVKTWVLMPKEWKDKYKSVEEMAKSEEYIEAKKRNISILQWLDLLHIADAASCEQEWIDENFKFPGRGRIETEGDLELNKCTELTRLPNGLTVGKDLRLEGCTGLTKLPEGLKVEWGLYLAGCTGLTEFPEKWSSVNYLDLSGCAGLTKLPERLKVGEALFLRECAGLTKLPEGLSILWDLDLDGCTGLTKLPEGLSVGENLWLNQDGNEQVKKDAERLKKEGKIKGDILYR